MKLSELNEFVYVCLVLWIGFMKQIHENIQSCQFVASFIMMQQIVKIKLPGSKISLVHYYD